MITKGTEVTKGTKVRKVRKVRKRAGGVCSRADKRDPRRVFY